METIADLPDSHVWPDETRKDGKCLQCKIAFRKRFSWFCSKICEHYYTVAHKDEV